MYTFESIELVVIQQAKCFDAPSTGSCDGFGNGLNGWVTAGSGEGWTEIPPGPILLVESVKEAPSEVDVHSVGNEAETETVEPSDASGLSGLALDPKPVPIADEINEVKVASLVHADLKELPLAEHKISEAVEENDTSVVDENARTAKHCTRSTQKVTFRRTAASPLACIVEIIPLGIYWGHCITESLHF